MCIRLILYGRVEVIGWKWFLKRFVDIEVKSLMMGFCNKLLICIFKMVGNVWVFKLLGWWFEIGCWLGILVFVEMFFLYFSCITKLFCVSRLFWIFFFSFLLSLYSSFLFSMILNCFGESFVILWVWVLWMDSFLWVFFIMFILVMGK